MTFTTSRTIPATAPSILSAFQSPARLAAWWGPAGFTNTFETCEFRPGGAWKFVMHGPDGKDYPNESVFEEAGPDRVVIQHVSLPRYRLTITLESAPGGTVVRWVQAFENEKVAKAIAHIVQPANEENLDKLAAEVVRGEG